MTAGSLAAVFRAILTGYDRGRMISAPAVSRVRAAEGVGPYGLTILRATARVAPTEERDVEDAVPYGLTSAGG